MKGYKANLIIYVVFVVSTFVVLKWWYRAGNAAAERQGAARCDTVFMMVRDTVMQPVTQRIIRYKAIPADTVHDTVYIPIQQLEYATPNYHAWVSGYEAKLDSIDIRQSVVTKTIVKKRPWGAGIAAGYGAKGPYIGIGLQYNILSW
jgi:hypothetical protein